ncbi:hypothetical protein CFP56_017964 [Quercus suber]|uniref:Uncharacterized protein n=1 Tax=Quercus suber TaxID=58331 RepID=A0AAW0KJ19_QUESU
MPTPLPSKCSTKCLSQAEKCGFGFGLDTGMWVCMHMAYKFTSLLLYCVCQSSTN